MCSVHKATIPIAKFRNAIADEDKDEGPGFRCEECAKLKPVTSKRKAISLQETREQEFIKNSVMIDTRSRKVIVNYPF